MRKITPGHKHKHGNSLNLGLFWPQRMQRTIWKHFLLETDTLFIFIGCVSSQSWRVWMLLNVAFCQRAVTSPCTAASQAWPWLLSSCAKLGWLARSFLAGEIRHGRCRNYSKIKLLRRQSHQSDKLMKYLVSLAEITNFNISVVIVSKT